MKVVSFLKLIRVQNLIMVFAAMYLVRYMIVFPIIEYSGSTTSISELYFSLLAISVLLVTMGGYIINNLYDIETDKINLGNELPVLSFSKQNIRNIYITCTLMGVITGTVVTILLSYSYGSTIFILCAGLLYYYSVIFKKVTVIGNLIVSLLTALMIYIPVLFDENAMASSEISMIVLFYSLFAFMISFARELIKDCEDIKGDMSSGYNTLPITIGATVTRKITALTLLILLGLISYIQVYSHQWENIITFLYVSLFIQIPLIVVSARLLLIASDSQTNSQDSNLLKIVMISGMISMIILNYFS